jgi:hypothetical protein
MNRDSQHRLERAWFTLTNAEALGVKFRLRIEADCPRHLTVPCMIFRLVLERAGAAE